MPPDHFLPPDLPDAAAAYIESMPPGRVELFSLAPLDRTGCGLLERNLPQPATAPDSMV